MKKKILVVEDEIRIARVLSLELTHEGYEVQTVANGKDALTIANCEKWDLILLDIMLPELSGFEVLRRIRIVDSITPIILLTARNSVFDKVNGLDHGANDYITKPFEMEELLARVRSAIRIAESIHSQQETIVKKRVMDDLEVDESARLVSRTGVPIELTRREFDLLLFMIEHPNQVLTREQLLNEVWGFDYIGETNVVDVYIGYLRKKIETNFSHPLIHTVRGIGFMMKGLENDY